MARVFDRVVTERDGVLVRVCVLGCGSVEAIRSGGHSVVHGPAETAPRCVATFHACPTCPPNRGLLAAEDLER